MTEKCLPLHRIADVNPGRILVEWPVAYCTLLCKLGENRKVKNVKNQILRIDTKATNQGVVGSIPASRTNIIKGLQISVCNPFWFFTLRVRPVSGISKASAAPFSFGRKQ
jgi:hypothetical protein